MQRSQPNIRLTGEELALGMSRVTPAPVTPERGDLLSLADDLILLAIAFGVAYLCTWLQYRSTSFALLLWLPRLVAYGFAVVFGGRFLYRAMLELWSVSLAVFRRIFAIAPKITCPRCATRTSAKAYVSGDGCRNCHATTATCTGCEREIQFMRILTREGCPHCHERSVYAQW